MPDQPKAERVDALPDDEAADTAAYLRSQGEPDKDLEDEVERQEQHRKAYQRQTERRAE